MLFSILKHFLNFLTFLTFKPKNTVVLFAEIKLMFAGIENEYACSRRINPLFSLWIGVSLNLFDFNRGVLRNFEFLRDFTAATLRGRPYAALQQRRLQLLAAATHSRRPSKPPNFQNFKASPKEIVEI